MDATAPKYNKIHFDKITKEVSSYLKKVGQPWKDPLCPHLWIPKKQYDQALLQLRMV